jgi:acyl dehydratase
MPEKYWDDFADGFKFRTASITVTETHVVNWAGLTMDFYPLHTDKEYAAKTVFKERLAHGPLIFGMSIGMIGMARVIADAVIAWLGVDSMRMLGPVRIGDTITVETEMVKRAETKDPARGIQTWEVRIFNQNNEKVMAYEIKYMMHRRA